MYKVRHIVLHPQLQYTPVVPQTVADTSPCLKPSTKKAATGMETSSKDPGYKPRKLRSVIIIDVCIKSVYF